MFGFRIFASVVGAAETPATIRDYVDAAKAATEVGLHYEAARLYKLAGKAAAEPLDRESYKARAFYARRTARRKAWGIRMLEID